MIMNVINAYLIIGFIVAIVLLTPDEFPRHGWVFIITWPTTLWKLAVALWKLYQSKKNGTDKP